MISKKHFVFKKNTGLGIFHQNERVCDILHSFTGLMMDPGNIIKILKPRGQNYFIAHFSRVDI